MTSNARLIPDMMEPAAAEALKSALEDFYQSDQLIDIWPSAIDHDTKSRIPLEDVEIVVLPLDRIGAPAGASGSGVYVAYYTHGVEQQERRTPSQPLVVKIGDAQKLQEEKEGADSWPHIGKQARQKFAFPIYLFQQTSSDKAVLLAPYQSWSEVEQDGSRNRVEVNDLWRLLEDKRELSMNPAQDWVKIERLVLETLKAIEPPHRGGRARPPAQETNYAVQYEWYLRGTTNDNASHIPRLLFGGEPRTNAFGRDWTNPTAIVHRIINSKMPFSGILGAVHGDLHPKNIVLSESGSVRIIDFGWAANNRHIVVDYVLLDLNLRGTTLPSQLSESDILAFAGFLNMEDDVNLLPEPVRMRAQVIKNIIWTTAKKLAASNDWTKEYLIPLFLVGYGLLVHLDSARNQPSLIATVLHLARQLDPIVPGGDSV